MSEVLPLDMSLLDLMYNKSMINENASFAPLPGSEQISASPKKSLLHAYQHFQYPDLTLYFYWSPVLIIGTRYQ